MDIDLIRTLTGVTAADDAAKDYLRKWPVGEKRRADVRRPRDYKSLKRWMGRTGRRSKARRPRTTTSSYLPATPRPW